MRLQMRALLVVLLLGAMLVLSGCIDIIYQVQVAEDGSGNVRVIAAYDPQQLRGIQSSTDQTPTTLITDQLRLKAAASGLQIDEITADTQNALRVAGTFASPEEFSQTLDRIEELLLSVEQAKLLSTLGVKPSLDGTLTVEKHLLSTEYVLSIPSGTVEESGEGTPGAMPLPSTKIDYAAVARMPGETVSTNGRYQPGDASLVWPADPEEPSSDDYTAVSRVTNWNAIALAGGIAALLLVAAVILLIRSRRKKSGGSAAGSQPPATRAKPKGKQR